MASAGNNFSGSEKMKHGTGMKESPQEHVMMGDSSLIGMDVAKRVDRTCKRMRWCPIWWGHSWCTTTKTECLVQLLSISYPPTSFCVASLPKGVGHRPSMSIALTCCAMFIAFKRMLINRKVGSIWQWWPSFQENPTEPLPKPAYIRQYTSSVVFVHGLDSSFWNSWYGLGWSGFAILYVFICPFFGFNITPKKLEMIACSTFFFGRFVRGGNSWQTLTIPTPGTKRWTEMSPSWDTQAAEVEQAFDPTYPQTVMRRLNA